MKQFRKIFTISIIALCCCVCSLSAASISRAISFTVTGVYNGPEIEDDDDRRLPSRPLEGIISIDYGVIISGCNDDILLYEVYIEGKDVPYISTNEETEFLAEFFALPAGEFELLFTTADVVYRGFIYLE